MVKTIEAKGDSIDAAVASALAQLQKERDDVTVEVLEKGKSGFLGFGAQPALVRVSYETQPAETAVDFIDGLLSRFGVPAQVECSVDELGDTININLTGENMGAVIGRRGDTLDAIQYLTSIVANKNEEKRWHVVLDTENYRAKRRATLEKLAANTAQKAIRYKRSMALEPMSPQERRIIHAALQEYEGVSTHSVGSEPNRKVIVVPDGVKENKPREGGNRPPYRSNRGNRPERG